MPKKIFIFDIDETLLCRGKSLYRLNSVEITRSSYDPYSKSGLGCYTLQKEKMAAIMQGIIANGDDIAFVTAGG
ncbi:hypothetical protein DA717_15460, partial [Piscirickettsiaceae bacterium NZ-RLO2]